MVIKFSNLRARGEKESQRQLTDKEFLTGGVSLSFDQSSNVTFTIAKIPLHASSHDEKYLLSTSPFLQSTFVSS